MKKLLLLLAFMPIAVEAQWEYELIEEACKPSTDYTECIYLIKINEGLYSLRQFKYLLAMHELEMAQRAWEEAQNLAIRSSWLLSKNEAGISLWRELQEHLIFYPDTDCFERGEGGDYIKQQPQCIELRYFIADSSIEALAIAERIYALTGSEADRLSVVELAGACAALVYGVDGPEFIVTREYTMEPNRSIRAKYRYKRYLAIQDEAEK